MSISETEGDLIVKDAKFCLVVTRWNSFVVESLLEGAIDTLKRHGAKEEDLHVVRVPGAVEIPLAVQEVAEQGKYDAIVALGAVIQGGTPHFDYVAGDCSRGLASINLKYKIPVAFGVLTVNSIEQAIERAGTKMGNKGEEAALSAIEMVNVIRQLRA